MEKKQDAEKGTDFGSGLVPFVLIFIPCSAKWEMQQWNIQALPDYLIEEIGNHEEHWTCGLIQADANGQEELNLCRVLQWVKYIGFKVVRSEFLDTSMINIWFYFFPIA